MTSAEIIVDVIADDFLVPTIDRLSRQLNRNIFLDVSLRFLEKKAYRKLEVSKKTDQPDLHGNVRVVASDTAVQGRFKYDLQCIFPESDGLEDFSGIRLNGAVVINKTSAENKYDGFAYTYNQRDWGKKLRDF